MHDKQYEELLEAIEKKANDQWNIYNKTGIRQAETIRGKNKAEAYWDAIDMIKDAQINSDGSYECADERI